MSRSAVIVIPSQEETQQYVGAFLRYIKEAHDYPRTALRDSIEGYYSEPLTAPPPFTVTINRVDYPTRIIDATTRKTYAAGLVICCAESSEKNMFFCIEKDAEGRWSAHPAVLDMEWREFIELSKAAQFTALNC